MGRSFLALSMKIVNLLSALSHLILFQSSPTHHCLIYKRPFNIHACLGDISQTLGRQLEIYWLCVLFCFVSVCHLNTQTTNLFHLVLKLLSFASQLSLSIHCISFHPFSSCQIPFVFLSCFPSCKYRNVSAMMRCGPFAHLLQALCHMPWLLMTPHTPTREHGGKRLENQRTSSISECHQH